MQKTSLGPALGIVGAVLGFFALLIAILGAEVGPPGPAGEMPPIGTILAWHESHSATPSAHNLVGPGRRWLRCNGQRVKDKDSPFNGSFLPDLNGFNREKPGGWPSDDDGRDWPYGERLFLRGGTVSGKFQEDEFKQHVHLPAGLVDYLYIDTLGGEQTIGVGGRETVINANATGEAKAGGGEETRPKNMSVVWIMRVK